MKAIERDIVLNPLDKVWAEDKRLSTRSGSLFLNSKKYAKQEF